MKPTRRQLLMATAACTAALGLAACSAADPDPGSSPTTEDGSATGGEPIDLTVAVWTDAEAHLTVLNGIADSYLADHPEIGSITFETLPWDAYSTTLVTRIGAGQSPDLAWLTEKEAPEWIANGALYDVQPAMQADASFEFDDLVASAMAGWQVDGATYGYPFSTSAFGLFYNATLLEEAGVALPDELIASGEWTWDEARDIAGTAAAETGKAGLVFGSFDYLNWDNLATLFATYGAQPWSEDGTTCEFDSPEMVEALSFFHDGVYQLGAFPEPGTSPDFFAGDSTMIITQISRASTLADAPFDWGLVPVPAGPAGAVPVYGQGAVAVLASSPHPEEASAFFTYLTGPDASEQLAAFFPPPRTSLLNADVLAAANPMLSEQQIEGVLVDGVVNGQVKPSHPNWAAVNDEATTALDALWVADGDAATVLPQVCEAISPFLDE